MYLLVVGGCLPLLGGLLVAHCSEVYKRGTSVRTLVEFLATGVLFLLPYYGASDGRFFHLHHWYYAWFLGMHCNLHGNWWSELAMSVLWGIYVNGRFVFFLVCCCFLVRLVRFFVFMVDEFHSIPSLVCRRVRSLDVVI